MFSVLKKLIEGGKEKAVFFPIFTAKPSTVHLMKTPSEFYSNLLCGIDNSKERIVLSALYIGDGNLEKKLIDRLESAMASNPRLQVDILVDYFRASRSSIDFHPLKKLFPNQFNAYLYHSPNVGFFKKLLLPNKYNEVFGLNHIKCFIFDNDIILSGANLHKTYFTNRQDRYILFQDNRILSNYFVDLVKIIGSFSYSVGGCELTPPRPHPIFNKNQFVKNANLKINSFIRGYLSKSVEISLNSDNNTYIIPLLQMGPLGIKQDESFVSNLLSLLHHSSDWKLYLTSGYFNFTKSTENILLNSKSEIEIITASEKANGFYKASGILKYIPGILCLL
jgi:CDP-diacylglycerol--glycerol-3-phosphate 3-phosphatidyltransferase